jgi:hypothetical protein
VDCPDALPNRSGKLTRAAAFAEEIQKLLRDGEPSPSKDVARNNGSVHATPENLWDHKARWKYDVKGYSRRAATKRTTR